MSRSIFFTVLCPGAPKIGLEGHGFGIVGIRRFVAARRYRQERHKALFDGGVFNTTSRQMAQSMRGLEHKGQWVRTRTVAHSTSYPDYRDYRPGQRCLFAGVRLCFSDQRRGQQENMDRVCVMPGDGEMETREGALSWTRRAVSCLACAWNVGASGCRRA